MSLSTLISARHKVRKWNLSVSFALICVLGTFLHGHGKTYEMIQDVSTHSEENMSAVLIKLTGYSPPRRFWETSW
jgi:hypothetical protein